MKNYILVFCLALVISNGCKQENNTPILNNDSTLFNVPYGNHELQNMDIYLPPNRGNHTKVVIMVHGGGWVVGYEPSGKITTFDGRYGWDILNPLLDKGYACVLIKYRTACYNTVPENFIESNTFNQDRMMEDIDLVIDHLKSKSSEYIIGDSHFQLLGESAGGHIVLTYGNRIASDQDLKSVISMFGPSNLDDNDWKSLISNVPQILVESPNYFLKKSDNCSSITQKLIRTFNSLKSFASESNIDILNENASLFPLCPSRLENIDKNTPTFVMHGAEDLLVPKYHADQMHAALRVKHNEPTCTETNFDCNQKKTIYENCGHGWTNGNCNRQQIIQDIIAWIDAH